MDQQQEKKNDKISVEDSALGIRIENFQDKFRLYWNEKDKQRFIDITIRELMSFFDMLLDGETKLKTRVTKKSMLLCKSHGFQKGKIWVYYKGDLQVEWGYFLFKFTPMDFYKLVSLFKNAIEELKKIQVIESRKMEEKQHYVQLYFYSGLLSLAFAAFSLSTTVVFLFFALEYITYPFVMFSFSAVYFAVFFFFQQQSAKNLRENVEEDFYTKLLPVLHTLPVNSRKLVEMFTILLMVFTIMAIYFAKSIPKIIAFYSRSTRMM
ncbi:MAG: hypothetical protein PHQ23_06560 [Candidatus Wallbacteria bacterium]|nr:hypothetical protein [Candidatus Wallbacteria bacterium]